MFLRSSALNSFNSIIIMRYLPHQNGRLRRPNLPGFDRFRRASEATTFPGRRRLRSKKSSKAKGETADTPRFASGHKRLEKKEVAGLRTASVEIVAVCCLYRIKLAKTTAMPAPKLSSAPA